MIALLLTIAIVGFLVWLLTTYVPMADPFKYVIYAVAAIVLILMVMRAFGIADIPLRG